MAETELTDRRDLAQAYIEAVGRKDWDEVEAAFHPDHEFHVGPTVLGKAAAIAGLRRLGLILLRNEVRETVVDGDEVCIVYDFVTDTPVGPVRSAELLTFEGDQVLATRLAFEHERWPEVLAELGRRTAPAS
jgi:hypothetical protein